MKVFLKTGLIIYVTDDEGVEIANQLSLGNSVISLNKAEKIKLALPSDQIMAILDDSHVYEG